MCPNPPQSASVLHKSIFHTCLLSPRYVTPTCQVPFYRGNFVSLLVYLLILIVGSTDCCDSSLLWVGSVYYNPSRVYSASACIKLSFHRIACSGQNTRVHLSPHCFVFLSFRSSICGTSVLTFESPPGLGDSN